MHNGLFCCLLSGGGNTRIITMLQPQVNRAQKESRTFPPGFCQIQMAFISSGCYTAGGPRSCRVGRETLVLMVGPPFEMRLDKLFRRVNRPRSSSRYFGETVAACQGKSERAAAASVTGQRVPAWRP